MSEIKTSTKKLLQMNDLMSYLASGETLEITLTKNQVVLRNPKDNQVVKFKTNSESDKSLKSEFEKLVKVWTESIKYLSSEKQQKDHPAFLRIVGMGEKVLPFIFAEFSKRPFTAWLSALEAIVGKNIAAEAKSFREAVNYWVEWGKMNGYLKP